ncbi:MAG: hypothetical protein AAF705_03835 [Bacteroidota bacterium]
MKTKVLLIFLTALMISTLSLQAQNAEEKPSYSITANPAYYILGGYSVKGYYITPQRWSFGLAAEASFELPDFARDQFFDNNEDITVDWDYLIGAEVRYRFSDSPIDKGLFLQAGFGYEGWTITNDDGQQEGFDNWYGNIGIGYTWYPFKRENFHLGGNYNIVFILNETQDRVLGDSQYNIRPVVPPSFIPSIFLGWRFGG